ncbi:MAG TPA: 4'-phosphopantetheinyl transferase superfamily protein [Pseudobdellovibrionaceae bacterium]|nr:4'-phosphopantetheinyl transferase superfamily protein [Pseudobdellovibrionaceae bacterium]
MAEIRIHNPEEAAQLAVLDFSERIGCHFVIVRFPQAYEAETALGLRKRYLGELLGIDPAQVAWLKNENGKPYLEKSEIRFSVSHSGPYWAFAYSNTGNIGIDLEVWRDWSRLSRIARRVFRDDENQSWMELSDPKEQVGQILTLWTRKEAYIKAKGSQLFRELSKFDAIPSSSPEIDLWTETQDESFVISWARLK